MESFDKGSSSSLSPSDSLSFVLGLSSWSESSTANGEVCDKKWKKNHVLPLVQFQLCSHLPRKYLVDMQINMHIPFPFILWSNQKRWTNPLLNLLLFSSRWNTWFDDALDVLSSGSLGKLWCRKLKLKSFFSATRFSTSVLYWLNSCSWQQGGKKRNHLYKLLDHV